MRRRASGEMPRTIPRLQPLRNRPETKHCPTREEMPTMCERCQARRPRGLATMNADELHQFLTQYFDTIGRHVAEPEREIAWELVRRAKRAEGAESLLGEM